MSDKHEFLDREKAAFKRTIKFTEYNSNIEKLLTVSLLFVWIVISIGQAFGYAEATDVYATLTGIVWTLVGRVWGQSVANEKNKRRGQVNHDDGR